MRMKEFLQYGGRKYTDDYYEKKDAEAAAKTGVPLQVLRSIRLAGEQSNENQVSEDGARGVYQFIPGTRNNILRNYGVDAWNPEQASLAAAYLLKENADRNGGDYNTAIREYHGGTKRANWGPVNRKYAQRTSQFLSGQNGQNGYIDPNYSINRSYADMSQYKSVFEDMQKGVFDYKGIQQAYQSDPEFTKTMMTSIGQAKDFKETQRLEQERQQQENQKKVVEQENLEIQNALNQQQAQRKQMLDMVPRLRSVVDGPISPQI